MGCVPVKSKSKTYLSQSLPILSSSPMQSKAMISELKRGMTLKISSASLNRRNSIQNQAYLRPDQDFDCKTATILTKDLTIKETQEIRDYLRQHFLFREIPKKVLKSIIRKMNYYILEAGEFAFQQGEPGYNFFLVASGSLEILIHDNRVAVIERGKTFGELALLHGGGRRAGVRSLTNVRLWGLGRDTFKEFIQTGNKEFYTQNKEFLASIRIFKTLADKEIEALMSAIVYEVFDTNEKIISEGELSSELYIIQEGSVNIFKNNLRIITLNKGEYFGEQSLLYDTTRVASAIAKCKTKLMCFAKQDLTKVLGHSLERLLYFNCVRIAFAKDPILKKLTYTQVNNILDKIKIKELKPVCHMTPSNELWVIVKGTIATDDDNGESIWKSLDCVYSKEFLHKTGTHSVKFTTENAIICRISRKEFNKCIGGTLKYRLKCNKVLNQMNKIYIFKNIPPSKLEHLSTIVTVKEFSENEYIFFENDPADHCYIIKSGKVDIIKNTQVVIVLKKFDYFGERAIIFSEPRSATARAIEHTEVWVIERDQFISLLDENLKKYLLKKSIFQDSNLSISDLGIVQKTGEGTYSETFLVRRTKALHGTVNYALKCIKKENVLNHNLLPKLVNDRAIHKNLNHPFIPVFVSSFKDASFLYMLYEFIPGPSLSDIIHMFSALNMKLVNFYSSIVLLTLEYLHDNNIVHREITSEAFLLDEIGYPILTHFSLAKVISERTFTVLGVPYYLSPEMIKGCGYSFYSDIWSLGILIFEMLYGVVPFGHGEQDPFTIYEIILNSFHKYPVFIKESMKPKGIIEKLLDKNPAMRGTAKDLKKHAWFDGIVWDDLLSKSILPGFLPENKEFVEGPQKICEVLQTKENDEAWAESF